MNKLLLLSVFAAGLVFSACDDSYSCSIHHCVATNHLNQGMLAAGKYGDFLDPRDDQVYKVVTIGQQTWMAQNLNYIPKSGEESWCWGNNEDFCEKYGRLYTWDAAMKVCPEGWHLPTWDDFNALIKHIEPDYSADTSLHGYSPNTGKLLKAAGVWAEYGTGSDDLGFSALPAGNYNIEEKAFFLEGKGGVANFWGATEREGGRAAWLDIDNEDNGVNVGFILKNTASSVRCVKNPN